MSFNPDSANTWEVNQGKRLIKRLHKVGVRKGSELPFLTQALKTAAATVAVDYAKGLGATPEAASLAALEAVAKVKEVQPSSSVGFDLCRLLMANGAVVGRVKSELDKVLFVTGISKEAPNDNAPLSVFVPPEAIILAVDEASPDYLADRFPSGARENY